MSAAWDRHISALNALMAQNGINPAAAPAPQQQAAPAPAMSMPTGNIFSNPSTTDTSLWQYLNGLNAQQTGLGPTGANISFMGPGYGADGLRMPEFGNTGYAGGPAGTGPDLSGLMGGMGSYGGPIGGLLGALGGGLAFGPLGGLLGGIGGRALAGLLGDFWGGDGMASGNELNSLGAQAAQNAENMAGAGFGDGRGL